ncbi:PLP-dependent aminotransferase family protein [Deinococcus peraridilitoris]|uniref:Transcriptional regulator with HTH domain and aminotransferase domain protein n=1 Tax=Deinococcus peraridilitoris (strain DSM 19664 / LMG 22246 / CIP 109416 / KR-200) TaxID=937777 RepID=L0A5N8_DEIPD|nr:PLP-dependent aminotransferase family protein [Deinococcus peraridilitoris]AFZ68335.1 transcriptional regulator with HTH domain and aminotransferase domain protein [Deinococcus peraridilitoris DSM 19664]
MEELIAARVRTVKPSFVREVLKAAGRKDLISFAGGLPAPELFDVEGMRQATLEALEKDPVGALQYGATEGHAGLRGEIAKLMAERGAHISPDQLVITTGSQQGIDLIARTLLDPGDVVLLEQPSYLAAIQVFELAQAEMRGIGSDGEGVLPDDLERQILALKAEGRAPKLIYLVATFANPSGATLSRERRVRVLELAAQHGIVVIEDDPYSELRFHGESVAPMVGLAQEVEGAENLSVYLSTLSKVVAPGLRVGWMVLPAWLQQKLVIIKQASDLHASTFAQHVGYRYLQSGRMEQHVPKIREAYGQRAQHMMATLERLLPRVLQFRAPEGGMFLWASMASGVDTMQLVPRAVDAGVIYVPGAPFFANPEGHAHHLRLSFSNSTPEQIEEGVRRLASVVMD